jgi:hypothetical protein
MLSPVLHIPLVFSLPHILGHYHLGQLPTTRLQMAVVQCFVSDRYCYTARPALSFLNSEVQFLNILYKVLNDLSKMTAMDLVCVKYYNLFQHSLPLLIALQYKVHKI